ncbi:enamine deaminase RidA (YjgF/YER057c/UK114 family) [Stackebrandtia albiflava]|uniref:Enamine deaminase RidA (YjgF/YER057c/UK114 family) n=1 Tax=Stackebrandtia albiflava TaxID=406432 RepID=A0A562V158_9ACTN|nr:RidA family protein [Stackebrandtia albiflava]TWJ11553.1 enamine deaminase RidA (YjgF/YER057c/UK114 family) [Stackebrandtia albiflava]
MNRYVNPPELAAPSGFSHAVIAPPGRTVYLAGQTAADARGRIVGGGESPDVVTQFAQCLSNLLTALAAAGGRAEHLVSMRIYLVDVPAYRARAREIGAVWRQLAGDRYPAAAGIGVARLWDDDAIVEIEGVAVIPG